MKQLTASEIKDNFTTEELANIINNGGFGIMVVYTMEEFISKLQWKLSNDDTGTLLRETLDKISYNSDYLDFNEKFMLRDGDELISTDNFVDDLDIDDLNRYLSDYADCHKKVLSNKVSRRIMAMKSKDVQVDNFTTGQLESLIKAYKPNNRYRFGLVDNMGKEVPIEDIISNSSSIDIADCYYMYDVSNHLVSTYTDIRKMYSQRQWNEMLANMFE